MRSSLVRGFQVYKYASILIIKNRRRKMGSRNVGEFCMILLLICSHCWDCKAKAGDDDDDVVMSMNLRHRFPVTDLFPSTGHEHHKQGHSVMCTPSPKVDRGGIFLEVRHKYGGCSGVDNEPSHVEMLEKDQVRVKWLRDRIAGGGGGANSKSNIKYENQVADLPTKSGNTIGSGNFIVTIALGTPKIDLSLVFDTGSDLTWTQCKPCAGSCYEQKEAIFDPRTSTTYSNISCTSQLCSQVRSATSATPGCSSSSTCVYGLQYGDSSFSVGYLAKDTLSLGTTHVPAFLFGCGQNNQGLFQGSAGILGLGRNKFSITYQTASNYFSYCLPSKPTYTGHLTFGRPTSYRKGTRVQYTPMETRSQDSSLYFIEVEGISVGGRKLDISPSIFSRSGTLIDSGTVITRLPPDAYSALQSSFMKLMSKYPKAPPLSILDTCYDFSSYTSVNVPKISILFRGGAHLDLGITGILLARDLTQVCLAFAGNTHPSDVAILGNIQQLTVDVVYDVGASKVGFAPAGCL